MIFRNSLQFIKIDHKGLHFLATICMFSEHSKCYEVILEFCDPKRLNYNTKIGQNITKMWKMAKFQVLSMEYVIVVDWTPYLGFCAGRLGPK